MQCHATNLNQHICGIGTFISWISKGISCVVCQPLRCVCVSRTLSWGIISCTRCCGRRIPGASHRWVDGIKGLTRPRGVDRIVAGFRQTPLCQLYSLLYSISCSQSTSRLWAESVTGSLQFICTMLKRVKKVPTVLVVQAVHYMQAKGVLSLHQ